MFGLFSPKVSSGPLRSHLKKIWPNVQFHPGIPALDDLLTRKAEGALRYRSQKYYEMGNRASRLLAFQLRKEQSNCIVPKIRHPKSLAEVSHPAEVADAFKAYYQGLYDAPKEAQNVPKFRRIFQNVNLSKLTETVNRPNFRK